MWVPHILTLKISPMLILLNNLCPSQDLFEGTQLRIRNMCNNCLDSKMDLMPSVRNLLFLFKRHYFPNYLAFCITIKFLLLHLNHNVFLFIKKKYSYYSHVFMLFLLYNTKNYNNR